MSLSEQLATLVSQTNALVPLAQALEAPSIPTYYVTSLADGDGAGTLRAILEDANSTPLRILSRVTGTVALNQNINARRNHVKLDIPNLLLTGAGIHWYGSDAEITNVRNRDAMDDCLFIRETAERIHVHHCTLSRCGDELLQVAGTDVLVEYCLLYDALPPTGGGLWTNGTPTERVVFRRNLTINTFKRAGNANTGQDTQVYENVFVNCCNGTFNAAGATSEVWHNVYVEGLDYAAGEWNVLKANGGNLKFGKNTQVKLDGSVADMLRKVDSTVWNHAGRYTVLPSPMSDDFAWQILLGDLYANAGASVRDDADNTAITNARNGTGRLPAPLVDYKG